jgi:hypothetical protein
MSLAAGRQTRGRTRSSPSLSGWSLALIGNASAQTFPARRVGTRGVFDEEASRKPLAFAADAVIYGI